MSVCNDTHNSSPITHLSSQVTHNSSPITPHIIPGNSFTDSRGTLRFVNDFDFSDVKRFYQIENSSTDVIRAWQAHKKENKYFFASSGSFLICAVEIDDWDNPSPNLDVKEFILSATTSAILMIPSGYANGIKALEEGSKLLVFSSNTLEDGKDDNYRFDKDLWYDWDKSKDVKRNE